MNIGKKGLFALALIVLLPGCFGRKKGTCKGGACNTRDTSLNSQVDLPLAGDSIKSYFDEDLGEFRVVDDVAQGSQHANDYAWVEDSGSSFKTVYFDFDRYAIKKTQENNVNYDLEQINRLIKAELKAGNKHPHVKILVEGHACHSAGSRAYNLALSEKRAKVLSDRLAAAGVPRENLQIVGRGQDVPAVIDGKVITGSRDEQWANRRDELRLIA